MTEAALPLPPALASHQRDAVERVLALLAQFGGAILADDVGLGKSFVAAAVACALDDHTTELIVPAALVPQWRETLHAFDVEARIITHDGLAGDAFVVDPARRRFLIVDEAHAFRNRATQRWSALARRSLCARLLLVTATPVCNSLDDLASLVALIAADDALRSRGVHSIDAAFHSRDAGAIVDALVIRRERDALPLDLQFGTLARRVVRHPIPQLATIDELAFPLVADCALLRRFLWRRLESSEAALIESIDRQLRFYDRALDALRGGRTLTKRDYRRAFAADDEREAMQQVLFWDVFAPIESRRPGCDGRATRPAEKGTATSVDARDIIQTSNDIRSPHPAFGHLLPPGEGSEKPQRRSRTSGPSPSGEGGRSPDEGRETPLVSRRVLASNDINAEVARLQQLRSEASASPSEKLRLLATIAFDEPALIFTGAVATANAIYNALKSTRCCGLVTARGSRDAIDAFKRGRIDVLVATDLAAEGLNLQRAGIVVHFDIPWNPVKLDQRNGRAHRIGQTRDEVRAIYFIPEERTTGIVETVAAKNRTRRRALAGGSVEGHPSVVALPSHMPRDAAPVALLQAIQRRGLAPPPALLRRWRAGVELLMIELSREFLDARKIADLAAILDAELTVSRASE